ncbi:MAG: PfkB family carbohydrate kinase [Parvibaculaceae bacterium]
MAARQVLTISSQVAAGPVGNSAIVPALLALGVTPIALPTIVLSNHPGHGKPEGLAVPAEQLWAMLERIVELGFLAEDDIIITGYFAHAEQIDAVASVITRFPKTIYLCDPILGDTPKGLYVPEAVATAIRDRLVPMADILTPNAFELGWLTGRDFHDRDTAHLACRMALWSKEVVVKSLPKDDMLMTTLFHGSSRIAFTRPKRADVPHGTGDLLSGLIAAQLALGLPLADALGLALAQAEQVITASAGTARLDLAAGLKDIVSVEAFRAEHG